MNGHSGAARVDDYDHVGHRTTPRRSHHRVDETRDHKAVAVSRPYALAARHAQVTENGR